MQIVPATPAEYADLAALYDRYAFAMREPAWMRWKYDANPYGGALTFKMLEGERLVGAASVQPRTWHHAGRQVTGIQLVDGLLGEEVRGRKYFRELTAFLLGQVPAGVRNGHFHFTVPAVPASVKACANAGLHALGSFDHYTCVLDPGVLRRVRGAGWAAPLLRPAWRAAQGAWLRARAGALAVEEIARFDQDMTPLFASDRVHGDRSAAFLNWRVFANPMDRLRAFLVRDEGQLAGYVVTKDAGRNLEIMDLRFVGGETAGLSAFLQHVAARRLAEAVDCGLLPGHPYQSHLRAAGFLRRGSGRGVFYVHGHEAAGLPADPALWDVNYLDSDW